METLRADVERETDRYIAELFEPPNGAAHPTSTSNSTIARALKSLRGLVWSS